MTKRRTVKVMKGNTERDEQAGVIDSESHESNIDEDSDSDNNLRATERNHAYSYQLSNEMIARTDSEVVKLLSVLKLQQSVVKVEHTGNKPSETNTKDTYWKHIRGLRYFCSLIGNDLFIYLHHLNNPR